MTREEAIVSAALAFCANKTGANEQALEAAVLGDPRAMQRRYETSGESANDPRFTIIDAIVRDVAELPDDYADDDANVMCVSVDDLRVILERHTNA